MPRTQEKNDSRRAVATSLIYRFREDAERKRLAEAPTIYLIRHAQAPGATFSRLAITPYTLPSPLFSSIPPRPRRFFLKTLPLLRVLQGSQPTKHNLRFGVQQALALHDSLLPPPGDTNKSTPHLTEAAAGKPTPRPAAKTTPTAARRRRSAKPATSAGLACESTKSSPACCSRSGHGGASERGLGAARGERAEASRLRGRTPRGTR